MNVRDLVTGDIGSLKWFRTVATLALTAGVLAVAVDMASLGYGRLRAAVGVPAYEVVSIERNGAVVVVREYGTGTLRLCTMNGRCHGETNLAARLRSSQTLTLEQALRE